MAEVPDASSFESIVENSLDDVKRRTEDEASIVGEEEVFGLLPEHFKKPDIGDPYAEERSNDGDSN